MIPNHHRNSIFAWSLDDIDVVCSEFNIFIFSHKMHRCCADSFIKEWEWRQNVRLKLEKLSHFFFLISSLRCFFHILKGCYKPVTNLREEQAREKEPRRSTLTAEKRFIFLLHFFSCSFSCFSYSMSHRESSRVKSTTCRRSAGVWWRMMKNPERSRPQESFE